MCVGRGLQGIFFGLTCLVLCSSAYSAQESSPQLLKAVSSAQKDLGPLEPWQKKIFDEEVVSQYLRFIRSYQAAASGELQVDVDLGAMRNYLKYHAPAPPTHDETTVAVILRADAACQKCTQSVQKLMQTVKARLGNRGLNPVFIPATDLGDPTLLDKDLAQQRGLKQVWVVSWRGVSEGEKRYSLRSFLSLRNYRAIEGEQELFEHDSFEEALLKLLADAWVEIGIKGPIVETSGAMAIAKSEVWVEISGINDFPTFFRVRGLLETHSPSGTIFLGERKVSQGKVVFAFATDLPLDDARKLFSLSRFGLADQPSLKMELTQ